jgi:putative ABC transport system substrate-binding protein
MASHIRRRKFLATLGGVAAWPLAARAQQATMPIVGLLGATSAGGFAVELAVFRQGLQESGYSEGKITIEYRWADNEYNRLPELATDLVHRHVIVIAAIGENSPTLAAKAATTTLPIVFSTWGPIRSSLDLSRASIGPAGGLVG